MGPNGGRAHFRWVFFWVAPGEARHARSASFYSIPSTNVTSTVPIHITHSTTFRASAFLRPTTSTTSAPHTSAGGFLSRRHSLRCFSASANSKATQFSSDSGASGSQRTSAGRSGTAWGGMTERPRWMSSKMIPTSSSSSGDLLCRARQNEHSILKHHDREVGI